MKTVSEHKKGVSLRQLFALLLILAILLSGLMIWSTFRLSASVRRLTMATDSFIEMENAVHALGEASDFLTEMVQRYTISGDSRYLNAYFTEANETARREAALAKLAEDPDFAEALDLLQKASNASNQLMTQEYYAMRLVIEAQGVTAYPDILREVTLSEEDAALSPPDKMHRATEVVLNTEYYNMKDVIRAEMQRSVELLKEITHKAGETEKNNLAAEQLIFRIIIVVQMLIVVAMIWLTSVLGITPVLKAVEQIKADSPIPEIGANEFRYLAQTYNRMYSVNKKSVQQLNFTASHDALTKVYNRAGYDLLMSGIDLGSTFFLLFDVDDFKNINDTHGHKTGDSVLIKIANTLKRSFRSDDYVCRLGGDEFAVIMVHASVSLLNRVASNVQRINEALADTSDGLPPISVSVGIAHGHHAASTQELFQQADMAVYRSKQKGKRCFTFYDEDFERTEAGTENA